MFVRTLRVCTLSTRRGAFHMPPLLRNLTPTTGDSKPPSGRGVAPTGGRGSTRNKRLDFIFGYLPPNLGCDNYMNFPPLAKSRCLPLSFTRSRGSSLREGALRATAGRPYSQQSAKSTLLQSLRRCGASSLCTREPLVCANIAGRTLLPVGGHSICPRFRKNLIP